MGKHLSEHNKLHVKNLLQLVREDFEKIPDKRKHSDGISIADCLMSALAMFSFKFPSLLQFSNQRTDEVIAHNLKTLYDVEKAPCDTFMRQRLDEVDPQELRSSFRSIFTAIQRGKVLEDYEFIDGHYLLPMDGTGLFSSEKIHCEQCCEKHHKDGRVTYYHQTLGAVLVHPDHKEVFPLCPEPILKQDGNKKNDCERNACFRLLKDFRREHPHLKVIATMDALSANGPLIRKLKELNMGFIIGVKPDGNKTLFEYLNGAEFEEVKTEEDGCSYRFRFINGVPLNDEHSDLQVNFFECWVDLPKIGTKHFSWVTDITITKNNVYNLSRGGRSRWKIENETFNTLKNQGYQFEHNFGHGYKHLSQVMSFLMFLAFLIDQVQQHCCGLFQAALAKMKTRTSLWTKMKSLFTEYDIRGWEDLFRAIGVGKVRTALTPLPP